MAEAPSPSYPARWEADVALADGGTAHVRPIRPDDGERVAAFHERQSPESIYYRFFSPRPRLSAREIERFTNVDYVDRMAFVALLGDDLIGVARYDRQPARRDAEVAFFTDDVHAGRGLATVLLEYLAAAARDVGIQGFTAQVLPQNRRMLSVFKQAGFAVTSRFSDGVVEVELAIEPTDEALAAIEQRARTAEARSVARILAPKSIAVVGASRRPDSLGHTVFRRLLEGGFEGPVYPVNPQAEHVASVRAHPSVLDVPDDVDLAVIVVPAGDVEAVVEDCGRKRVQGLVVVSAGFAEAGEEGAVRERRLVVLARRHGMRMIGPNTMGVINTAADVRLQATFSPVTPIPGRIGLSSQSGTIGAALLDRLCRHGLGVSTFVAAGNKADVSGNDLLQYWEDDDRTDLVALYLESFGNPRNFSRIARRVAQRKPIVAVKAGRSPRAAGWEGDGPDGWPSDATVDAMLRQTGVIRVDTLEQLFDVTRVLASQSLPQGRRVAVLSNFWGPAVLAADACLAAGLELADPEPAGLAGLDGVLGPASGLANPLEVAAEAGPEEYGAAGRALVAAPEVDALLVIYSPTLDDRTDDVAEEVAGVAGGAPETPVVASFLGVHPEGNDATLARRAEPVPVFAFPEAAAYALGRVADYAAWRARPVGRDPELDDVDAEAARAIAAAGLGIAGNGGGWLGLDDARALLASHGIEPVDQCLVGSRDGALAAAAAIGYPVAIKAIGLDRPAKTEAGGVAVDVHNATEVGAAYDGLVRLHGAAMRPALVQAMAPSGVDLEVTIHQNPSLGSVVTVAPAGATGPTEVAVVPLTDADADRLVAAVPTLGEQEASGVVDLVLRLSALADAVPEIAYARLDPVLASPHGASVTDVRIRLAPWTRPADPVVRRLA
jgi:acyl-CoA synthetase (NDP forming)/RimJ/RimL family protein N-acetyltransferase